MIPLRDAGAFLEQNYVLVAGLALHRVAVNYIEKKMKPCEKQISLSLSSMV